MKARAMALYLGVALLAIIVTHGCLDHNMIRCVGADGDDEDSWLDRMSRTSSPIDVQPEEYNHKGSLWIHHKHHHKPHHNSSSGKTGRRNLEISDLTSGESFAASTRTTPRTIVVAKDGSGHFKTVNAAVKSISKSNSQRVIIQIKAGIYKYI